MKIIFALIMAVALFAAPLAGAQMFDEALTLTPKPGEIKLAVGESVEVELTLHLKEGFHINSDQPDSEGLVPTIVTLEGPEGLSLAGVHFPKAVKHQVEFQTTPVSGYDDGMKIKVMLKAEGEVSGKAVIWVDYQACDGKMCMMPNRAKAGISID